MKEKLLQAVGSHVRLQNWSYNEMERGKVQISCHGTLEYLEDEQEFYVRISEDQRGHGCNGVNFYLQNVAEVSKASSGILEIILKG